jgi:hypothetical protein
VPYCEFYGLRLRNLELTITRFREACARGDLGAWRKFYAVTEAARPMARLGGEFEVYAALSQIGVGSSRLVPRSPSRG